MLYNPFILSSKMTPEVVALNVDNHAFACSWYQIARVDAEPKHKKKKMSVYGNSIDPYQLFSSPQYAHLSPK